MRDYSPKRRTAVVFTGSGTAGAYHAGVLKALDESGVKIDVVVGSGMGALAAAFAAVAGGLRLYGDGGFWSSLTWSAFYRVRPLLRTALVLLAASMLVLLLPVALGLLLGLLSPLAIVADLAWPGFVAHVLAGLHGAWLAARIPYLGALVAPIFVLSLLLALAAGRGFVRDRRRTAEALEFVFDAEPARQRLARALWEVSRGAALSESLPDERQIGERYVAWLSENLGQPGFRELILRAADLETGRALSFVLLAEEPFKGYVARRTRGPRWRADGPPDAVDLRQPACHGLLFPGLRSGTLPPLVATVLRLAFPRGGLHGGETHRLGDATLAGGCGIADAVAAGAEQVLVVSGVPERARPPARRRGPRALLDAVLATLERQALEQELSTAERLNRIVETLGHRTDDGRRAWQDPATGALYRDVGLFVVRPERRGLQPLELSGAEDPGSEVFETVEDLVEQGYRDAYRQFIEPVVGGAPEPRPAARAEAPELEL
jgi:hypothetical protein